MGRVGPELTASSHAVHGEVIDHGDGGPMLHLLLMAWVGSVVALTALLGLVVLGQGLGSVASRVAARVVSQVMSGAAAGGAALATSRRASSG
jgi:hypothetical protein